MADVAVDAPTGGDEETAPKAADDVEMDPALTAAFAEVESESVQP
jgi:hypothetical protein